MSAAHILVVEDEAVARDALAALLRDEGYEVSTAADGMSAISEIERARPSLVISDVTMPRVDGFRLVQMLRARPATAAIPVLLLSAWSDSARHVRGLDLGADDFLGKPIDVPELLARIRAQLRHVHTREELERRTVLDPLTGVLNRRGIATVLYREEQRAHRLGGALSVLMVDVDHFKAINDTHGHQVGDTVLRHVARVLAETVRIADHVGRFGGDEFVVVLPDTEADAAASLALRLRQMKLAALGIDASPELTVTVSIGAATLREGDTGDALLARADQAMYRVKRTGAHPAIADPRGHG